MVPKIYLIIVLSVVILANGLIKVDEAFLVAVSFLLFIIYVTYNFDIGAPFTEIKNKISQETTKEILKMDENLTELRKKLEKDIKIREQFLELLVIIRIFYFIHLKIKNLLIIGQLAIETESCLENTVELIRTTRMKIWHQYVNDLIKYSSNGVK